MFDEIIRELRQLERPRRISVSIPLDEKGYFDRVCGSTECGGRFKVLFEDWKDKVADACVFCPFCRHEAASDEWNTEEQQRHLASAAQAEMSRLVNNSFSRAVRRTPTKRFGGGLINFSMSLGYTPGRIPAVIPATASEELRQDFVCEACECRYASLGASFFCPACGHNSAVSCFDNTLVTVRKTLTSLAAMRLAVEETAGADVAKDAVRQIVEDQFPRLVGAFERLNEAVFDRLPNSSQFGKKGSVFQRLDDASTLWLQASGKGYGDFLNAGELQRLKLLFQRRHVLSHCQGIVDETYIEKSGDTSYAVGQRLVVRDRDVLELVELVSKLSAGLRNLV